MSQTEFKPIQRYGSYFRTTPPLFRFNYPYKLPNKSEIISISRASFWCFFPCSKNISPSSKTWKRSFQVMSMTHIQKIYRFRLENKCNWWNESSFICSLDQVVLFNTSLPGRFIERFGKKTQISL